MPEQVWKYEMPVPGGERAHLIPAAGLLPGFLGMQGGSIMFWTTVDGDGPLYRYRFVTVGTGSDVDPEYETYLGTVLDGLYVWHVFATDGVDAHV